MRAAQLVAPRRYEFLDIDKPVPQPGEVLVRMEYLSVCGSDLRTFDRELPKDQYPLPIGRPCHECVGTVEESRYDGLEPGTRVVALTYAGGLVEYVTLPGTHAVPVPESFDPALWVLCQPAGTVIYAIQQMPPVLGRRVVVLGQGPIGLMFTDLLARQGATQLIVTDLHDYRLEVSKRVGATHVINAGRENVAQAVAEITGGAMADIAIEAVGQPSASHQVFEVLKQQGLAVIFGLTHTEDVFPFDWGAMYDKLPRMIVTNSQRAGEVVGAVQSCVDLVQQERLDFSYLVTHRIPFKDVNHAYDLYSSKRENSLKLIMSV